MALSAGDANCTTGLSKVLYDNFQAATDAKLGSLTPGDAPDKALKALCWVIANSVITYIKANGVVSTTIGISTGALQTSAAPGSPTAPPAAPQTLTGSIS